MTAHGADSPLRSRGSGPGQKLSTYMHVIVYYSRVKRRSAYGKLYSHSLITNHQHSAPAKFSGRSLSRPGERPRERGVTRPDGRRYAGRSILGKARAYRWLELATVCNPPTLGSCKARRRCWIVGVLEASSSSRNADIGDYGGISRGARGRG